MQVPQYFQTFTERQLEKSNNNIQTLPFTSDKFKINHTPYNQTFDDRASDCGEGEISSPAERKDVSSQQQKIDVAAFDDNPFHVKGNLHVNSL